MAIQHQVRPKFSSKTEETVAKLREDAGAAASIDPLIKIKRLAALLSYEMALYHGGDFRPVVDHEAEFVMVARRPARTGS